VTTDAIPSSAAFDIIHSLLAADDAERKDAIKKANSIFAFTIKNKNSETDTWYIDLKKEGKVCKKLDSGKADGT
jgi:hypothetical protein